FVLCSASVPLLRSPSEAEQKSSSLLLFSTSRRASSGRFAMAGICCDLPKEMLGEAFSWLPPQSLIQFKCVSKSWYALIDSLMKDPKFVNKHLRNIDNKLLSSTCLVFFCVSYTYSRRRHRNSVPLRHKVFKSVTICHDDRESDHTSNVVEDFHMPTLPGEVDPVNELRGHCNGIICFARYNKIILCNPAIKEWRSLPKPCLDSGSFEALGVGFGYDSRGNDYKVVRFGLDRFLPDRIEYFKARAELYSLRSDSWREIEIHLELDTFPHLGKEVFNRGVIYWFLWTHNVIFSFNVLDEVFHSIPLPNNLLVVQQDHFIRLGVWNESVVLFFYSNKRGSPNSIEVWMMEDCFVGAQDSCPWTKKLVIGPLADVAIPLTFLKNYELLLQRTDGGLILYDLHSQILRNFTIIQGVNSIPCWDFSYVKSLVSVQGGSPSHS
ncbi:F-box domain containing protein, partial [Parasponia andersonii]